MAHPPTEILPRIMTAVTVAAGTPMRELPPLSEAINPDGLRSLVTGESSHDVTITFAYAGQRVVVHADSTVYVCPIQDTGPGPGGKPSVANR